jgi:hypothetical protein
MINFFGNTLLLPTSKHLPEPMLLRQTSDLLREKVNISSLIFTHEYIWINDLPAQHPIFSIGNPRKL